MINLSGNIFSRSQLRNVGFRSSKSQFIRVKGSGGKNEVHADFLPTVDFTYNFGRLTPNEDSQFKFNESKYGLMVTIPLFSGFETHYRTKSSFFKTQALARQKNQRLNDVGAEIGTLNSKIDELKTLFQINEKKLVSSQKYFDLTLAEYKRGVKNSPDVVGATERLFSTKKKKYELLKDLKLIKGKIEALLPQ